MLKKERMCVETCGDIALGPVFCFVFLRQSVNGSMLVFNCLTEGDLELLSLLLPPP